MVGFLQKPNVQVRLRVVDFLKKTLTYFLGEHMKAWKEFQKKYGEGTAADLDYGKLAILVLVIYIAIQVT